MSGLWKHNVILFSKSFDYKLSSALQLSRNTCWFVEGSIVTVSKAWVGVNFDS